MAVFLLGRQDQVRGDARVNLEILAHHGLEVVEVTEESDLNPVVHRLARAGLIVDALLGTGLDKPVQGLLAALIDKVNHLRAPVLAVDIPTGLSRRYRGSSGGGPARPKSPSPTAGPRSARSCRRGGTTWAASGRWISASRRTWPTRRPLELAEAREMRELLPARPFGSHKGTFGHLLVLAGSEGKTGAAALASLGGLRAGAGLVTLGIAASLNDILEVKLTEAMTLPLPEAAGARALGLKALEPILSFWPPGTALALGPGLGTHPETQELVRRLVRHLPQPMVVDADGVNAIAGDPACLRRPPGPASSPRTPGRWPAWWAPPLRRCRPTAWRWPGRPPPDTGWSWS